MNPPKPRECRWSVTRRPWISNSCIALRPTVVVVAVDVVQRVRIDRIRALGIPVYQVHVTRLAQMPESLRRLGALAGTEAVAKQKADELAAELAALDARYRNRAPVRVLYQIWDRPIYTIGGRHVITDALDAVRRRQCLRRSRDRGARGHARSGGVAQSAS